MADRSSSRPLDRAFDALCAYDRRRILHILVKRDGLALGDATPPGRDTHRYRTEMHHTHVPKLVDYGYVEFDADREWVRRGPRFGEIARFVAVLLDNRRDLPGDFP